MARLIVKQTRQGPSFIAKFKFRGGDYSRRLDDAAGSPIRSRAKADALWATAQARLARGEFPFEQGTPITKWLDDYLKFMKVRNASKTIADKTQRLEAWLAWHKKEYPKATAIADLTRAHVEAYQGHRAASCDPRTVNLDLAYLRHALEWAVDQDLIETNPMARVKRLKQPQRPRKTLESGTIAKVLAELGPVAKAAWAFSADTGCRPGEMFALTWDMVDIKKRLATFTQPKTGRVKTVPFSEATAKLMEGLPPVETGHVFYNRARKPFGKDSWRATVYWAAKRAKVIDWDGKRILEGSAPNPYALRHTFVTELLAAGVDLPTVRDAAGHGSIAVTNLYAHTTPERVRQAVERLQKRQKKA